MRSELCGVWLKPMAICFTTGRHFSFLEANVCLFFYRFGRPKPFIVPLSGRSGENSGIAYVRTPREYLGCFLSVQKLDMLFPRRDGFRNWIWRISKTLGIKKTARKTARSLMRYKELLHLLRPKIFARLHVNDNFFSLDDRCGSVEYAANTATGEVEHTANVRPF